MLEEFGEPIFPATGWFNALNLAASEFERLGPMPELKPPLCATEANAASGTRNYTGFGSAGDILVRSVGSACDSWLTRRGIAPDRLF